MVGIYQITQVPYVAQLSELPKSRLQLERILHSSHCNQALSLIESSSFRIAWSQSCYFFFVARTLAHLARAAALILANPAGDMWRFGFLELIVTIFP